MPDIEYELLQVGEKEMMQIMGDEISVEHPAYFCITAAGTIRVHPPLDSRKDALVKFVCEMFGAEEAADSLEGVVVGEETAEQRLLGCDVDRRLAERRAKQ